MEKALLVVSFGTTYKETREKTIYAIEDDIRAAFPGRGFYRAWTSPRIIAKVGEKEGLHVDTVEEAVERMKADGVKDVLVQPTHMMNGFENRRLLDILESAKGDFARISCGTPVLTSDEDMKKMVAAIMDYSAMDMVREGTAALVLMGHGSPGGPNEVYLKEQDAFREAGYSNVFIGTVEAEPSLSDVIEALKEKSPDPGAAKVFLAPFMVVAGDHALKDMTGDADDTWEKQLKGTGYDVIPVIKGLGEYPGVRALFVEHARDAEGDREK